MLEMAEGLGGMIKGGSVPKASRFAALGDKTSNKGKHEPKKKNKKGKPNRLAKTTKRPALTMMKTMRSQMRRRVAAAREKLKNRLPTLRPPKEQL